MMTPPASRGAGGPRIVVVGGGVAGLSAAMHSARLGAASVAVLERASIAAGSSGLSAGIVNRQTFDPVDAALRVASGEQFAMIEAQTSFRVTRCGYVRVARTEEQWEKVEAAKAAGSLPHTRLITPAELGELVPGMRVDDVVGAMYGPDDGVVDGPELCQAYLDLGRAHGVEFRRGVEVLGAAPRPGGGVRVETDHGDVDADVVINAAGPWFAVLGERLGAPLPIDDQRHQIAIIHVPSVADRAIPTVQTYFPGSGEDAVYVRPEGPGRFIAGLHSYESTGASVDPDQVPRGLDEGYVETLAEHLLDRFPGWDDAGFAGGWSGLYPLSPDGRFIVGPHPDRPEVIALGGLGGVGVTVSPAVGQLAAEWGVLGEPRSFEFAAELHPARFGGRGPE